MADNLKEASYQIRERQLSEYPIFLIAEEEIKVGNLLYRKHELETDWNYYASTLEEFLQLGLVDVDKLEEFKKTYKDADEYCCLFVVEKSFINFVFIPFPEE